jgi:hypothetical protein
LAAKRSWQLRIIEPHHDGGQNLFAFGNAAAYYSDMSLVEIKNAVDELSPTEVTELATFIRDRDNAIWDRQIDTDFAENGRLRSVLEEVRSDVRAGRVGEMP